MTLSQAPRNARVALRRRHCASCELAKRKPRRLACSLVVAPSMRVFRSNTTSAERHTTRPILRSANENEMRWRHWLPVKCTTDALAWELRTIWWAQHNKSSAQRAGYLLLWITTRFNDRYRRYMNAIGESNRIDVCVQQLISTLTAQNSFQSAAFNIFNVFTFLKHVTKNAIHFCCLILLTLWYTLSCGCTTKYWSY